MGLFSTIGTFLAPFTGGISAPIGAFADVIAPDVANSAVNYLFGQKQADNANAQAVTNSAVAWDREMGAYRSRYQNTMEDMRAAGLNPILAATGGFNVGNAPSIASAQSFMGNTSPVNFGSTAYNLAQSFKAKEEGKKAVQEAKAKVQEIRESMVRIYKMRAEKSLVTTQEKEVMQRIFNLEQTFFKIGAEIDLINMDKSEVEQRTQVLRKTAQEIQYKLSELKRISNAYDGPAGGLLGYIKAIFGDLNLGGAVMLPLKRGGK